MTEFKLGPAYTDQGRRDGREIYRTRWSARTSPFQARQRPGNTEERLPPTRLNAGCGFRKETIAGMRRNGRDAPIPDLPALAPEREGFDPKQPLGPG